MITEWYIPLDRSQFTKCIDTLIVNRITISGSTSKGKQWGRLSSSNGLMLDYKYEDSVLTLSPIGIPLTLTNSDIENAINSWFPMENRNISPSEHNMNRGEEE